MVGVTDFFGAGVVLVAQDKKLKENGLVRVCKEKRRGRSTVVAGGAKWAFLGLFRANQFYVGRLLLPHLDSSSISLFDVAIWSPAPFICTQVDIVNLLVLGRATVVSKAWVGACQYTLLKETLLMSTSKHSPKMANGFG